jgi:hypothetical protein
METHGSTLPALSLTGKKNTTLFEWLWMGCPHAVNLFVQPSDPPDEKRISQADFERLLSLRIPLNTGIEKQVNKEGLPQASHINVHIQTLQSGV